MIPDHTHTAGQLRTTLTFGRQGVVSTASRGSTYDAKNNCEQVQCSWLVRHNWKPASAHRVTHTIETHDD